jgi:ABC-type branched-subunit amino acid transport system ATPase component/ABC-type branched-subunit amino acid transport system permease subunit
VVVLTAVLALLPAVLELRSLLLVQQALYLGLLGLSLNLLVNTTGLVSFGHAMFFAFGAYLVGISAVKLGWSPLLGLALTPLVGAVTGLLVGLIVFRGAELYFSLLTFGMSQLVWATAHGWQSLTGGTNGTTGVFAPEPLSPLLQSTNLYLFILATVAVCTLLLYVVTTSPFGDALRAIRDNRVRAELVGLPVRRYELAAFVIAATFGAVAGGLGVVAETSISSERVDWRLSALALIVVLIGGMKYFIGPLVGAAFYVFAFDYILQRTVLWDTVLGIVVLFVALAAPSGLAGLVQSLAARVAISTGRVGGQRRKAVDATPERSRKKAVDLSAAPLPNELGVRSQRPADEEVVIEVSGVTKRFGGVVAVDNVTLAVHRASVHAVIGPNGAGKTTLFNIISGLTAPDDGEVNLAGEKTVGVPPWRLAKRGVGRSFQHPSLFWSLSSLENTTIARSAAEGRTWKLYGHHSSAVRSRAHAALARLGLAPSADVVAAALSHGDQRSLELAVTLAPDSRLLLLDEPTAGLSLEETMRTMALIRSLAKQHGFTVIFVEHDMDVVFGIADWITVLHQGTVLADGVPTAVRANAGVQRAYLGERA